MGSGFKLKRAGWQITFVFKLMETPAVAEKVGRICPG
jgi:hypothetical protein